MGQGKQRQLQELSQMFALPFSTIQILHAQLLERYPSGVLSKNDIGDSLCAENMTAEFRDVIFAKFDSNEYMYWKLWYSAAGVSQRLEFVFDSLDVDKSGYLTRDECGLLLTAVLGNCAPKVKDEWFDILDKQKDDKITKSEFLAIESIPEMRDKLNRIVAPMF